MNYIEQTIGLEQLDTLPPLQEPVRRLLNAPAPTPTPDRIQVWAPFHKLRR